ncbi:hypothetical protein KCU90_g4019, partial [Aureobasidium melanogenum]
MRIALIEPDLRHATLVGRLIFAGGHMCQHFTASAPFLDQAADEFFDLLITEAWAGDRSAEDAIPRARSILPGLPVIVLLSDPRESQIVAALHAGADDCLAKPLLTIGINHHTAPVALRERVAFPLEQIKPALDTFKSVWLGRTARTAPEAAILSTCNRTELYCATDDLAAREAAIQWFSKYHNLPIDELAPHVYALPQSEAVRHAFRVASGL